MKINFKKAEFQKAFTITEMMVTAALGLMVIGGTLTLQLVGARMFQFTQTKLGGNDDARSAIAKLVQDVRTAKLVKLGQGDLNGFTPVGVNSVQQGNAIEIYPTGDTNNFIRYFRHTDDRLRRTTNNATAAVVLANFVTNNLVFTSEDFQGNVLTNNENNRVIGLTLQFYQIQYPVVRIGTNQLYDFYQVRTKITRRTLE